MPLLPTAVIAGRRRMGGAEMVRYANTSKTAVSVLDGLTSCATHHFRGGSLHAPYGLSTYRDMPHGLPVVWQSSNSRASSWPFMVIPGAAGTRPVL